MDGKMATRVLESYHLVFPRIRTWHAQLRDTVYRERKLVNPFGATRYFYGRICDDTYRQAYAWLPQSTIPMLTNHLMLALCDQRSAGKLDFWLHAQIHDSVLLSCKQDQVSAIAAFAFTSANWHPTITLPAGKLIIPCDLKYGRNLGQLKKYTT